MPFNTLMYNCVLRLCSAAVVLLTVACRFKGLGPQEMLIYQLIQKEGNMGIWLRDIRKCSKVAWNCGVMCFVQNYLS